MAVVTKGYTFGTTEQVTSAKLHTLVDGAVISSIVSADIDSSAAIADSKLAQITTAGKVSGAAITLLASIPSVWADYKSTSTIVGWTSTSGYIYYLKIGTMVFVQYSLSGTSNSTSTTFTLPYASAILGYGVGISSDSGGANAPGLISIAASSTVTLYSTINSGAWTGSGTKAVYGQFFYQTA